MAPLIPHLGVSLGMQAGVDAGVAVITDAVDLHLSADIGWIGLAGVGLTVDARLGLAARF